MEDKQKICELLCATLQATREHSDLARIQYEEIDADHQRVVLCYDRNYHRRTVNVSLDSGIAMIRDILRATK